MMRNKLTLFVVLLAAGMYQSANARQWSLRDCINYALNNNINLQKTRVRHQSALEDVRQSKAALLPSLSGSTSQNVSYNPWPETGSYTIAGTRVQSQVDKAYYNGSYGINASWTIWDGNRNHDQVRLNQITADQAALDSATTANSIQEQITQLFVQILYSEEAVEVNKATLETSKKNEERGGEFVKVGNMSKADLAQLTAQRAQDEYKVVQSESQFKEYKRQLKQLLQITSDEDFDVVVPHTTDEMAMDTIPPVTSVYNSALGYRPEIQNAKLGIKSSELSLKMAKALRMPTIGLSANLGTNTTSMSNNAWGRQLKNNFISSAGLSISIPIFDQRQWKTTFNKAMLQKQDYELDLRDKQTTLYSTIENYWLQAYNNQAQFKSAKVSTESAQTSYDLLQEQFKQNLKNVIELMNGKDALLRAKQNELQTKYLAIYNIDMLRFYQTGELK
ncbi:TolC family protein [Hallella multisaccharivorax]|uniref:TolC family protein n=1 Tax=Hallella multisaccharivorax TaxID=310514 RepID=UPI0036231549